ncbi:MAG: metal ABC transporter substrate-binding protein [Anaerolineae bacterium]
MTKWGLWLVALLIFSLLLFTVTACTLSATATPEKVEHEAKHKDEHEHEHGKEEAEHEHEMLALSPVSLDTGEKLKVVATTSIVADVVENVGGDRIELTRLMPLGTDPHTFEPTPQDAVAVSDAHVLFANGAGLEEFLEPLLESAGAQGKTVYVSHGIESLHLEGEHAHEQGEEEAEHEQEQEGEGEHHHEGADPHTWTDPLNVIVWVHNVGHALQDLDPDNAEVYEANAEAYETQLKELDAWIRDQVAQVPAAERRIVTDHDVFGYFVRRYGFVQAGTIVPGYSTLSEPSARELAELEDAIRALSVKAVFVGNTVNPGLAERVAEDTGTRLVFLYTGSLGAEGSGASTYVDYTRHNVNAIVGALK